MFQLTKLLIVWTFLLLCFTTPVIGQIQVQGTINDNYGNPVSYATLTISDNNKGTVSDINGRYKISLSKPDTLHVFYLGLQPKSFFVDTSGIYNIQLAEKSFKLDEVVVFPGINPADTIMQKVIARRSEHDPMNLPSFKYTAYNKFYIALNRDTLEYFSSRGKLGGSAGNLVKMAKKSNLFVSEAISEKYYKAPGKMRENVLTTNISGFRNPAFAVLGSQLHSLSCYDDFFNIGTIKYVNPVSPNAEKKYFFLIKDTLTAARGHNIYLITFRPKAGTSFSAMYGMIYVDGYDYAVRKLVAQPTTQSSQIGITVRQEYDKLEGKYWFPTRLQSRINFTDKVIDSLPPFPIMIGYASTSIMNPRVGVKIPKSILRRQFEFNYAPDVTITNDSLLQQYRSDSLTPQDLYTFKLMDTLQREIPFFRWMNDLPLLLATGELPLGYFTLNLKESIGFNLQERWRYGLSLMTSYKVLNWIRIGGKFIRSHEEGDWRYAARAHLNPLRNGVLRLKYQYQDETSEKGAYAFYNPYRLGMYNLRSFVLPALNYVQGHEAALELEYPRYVNLRAKGYMEKYSLSHTATDTLFGDFNRSAIRFDLRYAPGEKLGNLGKFRMREGAGGPVFNLSYERGLAVNDGDVKYERFLGRFSYNLPTRFAGTFRIMGNAGMVTENIPLELAFNGRGSGKLHFYEPGVFQTMPVYSYFHTRFVNGFMQHYLPIHSHQKNIMFSLTTQLGVLYGDSRDSRITEISSQAQRGYYEAGLMGGLMNPEWGQIILGAFYNFGEYAQNDELKNIYLVIGLTTALDW
ncbi:DUF5686 and carboxypeptidase-like regulatory domain-containing protein [Salinivirga cyanobacteriivorans]